MRVVFFMLSIVFLFSGVSGAADSGELLFKKHCAVCHPGGGNIINPQRSLHKQELETRNIKSSKDVVATMRKPGPGMTKFDEKMIPDKDALLIGEYILKTF
jgi:cytochrome c6